jgi:hypothetical protein
MPQDDANMIQAILESAVIFLQKVRLNNFLAYSNGLCSRQLSLVLFIRILFELSFLRLRLYSFIARLQSDAATSSDSSSPHLGSRASVRGY